MPGVRVLQGVPKMKYNPDWGRKSTSTGYEVVYCLTIRNRGARDMYTPTG